MRKDSRFTIQDSGGQSLIELMITVGLMAIPLPALLFGFIASRSGRAQSEQRQLALSYAREGQEAARVFREADWTAFAVDGTYYPKKTAAGTWTLTPVAQPLPATITGYRIQISPVFRDSITDAIVATCVTGCYNDSSTKQVTTTVTWDKPIANSSVSTTGYLTRNGNLPYTDTSINDFSNPPSNSTYAGDIKIASIGDGAVTLGTGIGSGNWCQPSLALDAQDLPKNGAANGIYAIEGTVFAATGDNASGVSFAKVTVTTTYPPHPQLQNTYDGFKTNGIFGEKDYAYLATDTNSKEIDIINLNSVVGGKYQEAGWFNAPGNGTGSSVYVYNNIGYMTDGSKLYTFDVSSKIGDRGAPLGSATITGTGNKVKVIQDPVSHIYYAFVASSSTTSQLQIFQVSSDGKTISLVGSKGLSAQGAVDLFVSTDGTRVYLITANATAQNVFILNTSNKGSIPAPLDSTSTSGMTPKGITFIQNRAIVVGTGGTYQYQVFQVISDKFSNCDPADSTVGKLAIGTGVNGVSSVFQGNGDAYSYIITGDASSELKIIRGGAGGAGGLYTPSGIFQSRTFDAGHTAAFNYFSVNDQTIPGTTAILYEISIKPGLTGGSCGVGVTCCKDVPFGPGDFTPNPFTPPTALPFKTSTGYANPGQCLQYRATLTTNDTSQTPYIYDVTFSYSP